jgi:hypothetical protein
MSKCIPLSQGKVALVDDADFDRLSAYQWFLSGTGYAVGFLPGDGGKFRLEYMHRLIMQAAEGQLVDHINGDSLDNRQTNLRFVTPRQNLQNKRLSSLSLTGLKGWAGTRPARSITLVFSFRASASTWVSSTISKPQRWLTMRPPGCCSASSRRATMLTSSPHKRSPLPCVSACNTGDGRRSEWSRGTRSGASFAEKSIKPGTSAAG